MIHYEGGREEGEEERRGGGRGGERENSHGVEELLVFIISLIHADQHIQLIYQFILHL